MTTISKHVQAAPATAYALDLVRAGKVPNRDTALVLLALAAAADEALYSGNGYSAHEADDLTTLLAFMAHDMGGVQKHLDVLVSLGILDTFQVHNHRRTMTKFRIPQVAYDRANGDA